MAEWSEDDRNKKVALAGGDDRIGALPDDLLQQVLSLVPSRDAVRTCVLATRWRTLWKSVPSLRINTDEERYESVYALKKFVNRLLLLRDRTPLHECEINSYYLRPNWDIDDDEIFRYIELWLRYAVSCQVQKLRVHITRYKGELCPLNVTLLSQHLMRLELYDAEVGGDFLNFLSCPTLKVLKMEDCAIMAERISSQSLTHLIIDFRTFEYDGRTRISAPCLIEFDLDHFTGHTPLLEPMPSLVRAFLRFGEGCEDCCDNGNYFGDCGSESCGGCSYSKLHDKDDCVILDGLSGTVHLVLSSLAEWFIGRMDFKWHVIFSQLKTLLLGEWCVDAYFSGIIYFIKHSPILETLTLQLDNCEAEDGIEKEESYSPWSRFLVSKHLKVVQIKCLKMTMKKTMIHQIVKILGIHGVSPECISIKPDFPN